MTTFTKGRRCGTKKRYDTKAEADNVKAQMIRTGGAAPGSLGAYACPHCKGFHIGHRQVDHRRRKS